MDRRQIEHVQVLNKLSKTSQKTAPTYEATTALVADDSPLGNFLKEYAKNINECLSLL